MLLKNRLFKNLGSIGHLGKLHQTEEKTIALALHHVAHLAASLKKENIPLHLVWIAHPCQLNLSDEPACDIDYALFEKGLVDLATKDKNVSFFSSSEGLRRHMGAHSKTDYFYPDRHFNLKSYQFFAELVYPSTKVFVQSGD